MTSRRRGNRAWLGGMIVLCSLAMAPAASAQIALFSQIVEPLPAAYDQHLIKLTYMGPQKKNVASLGLHTPARTFDYAPFVPFYQPGLRYANDGVADRTAELTTSEIDAFVTRMQLFPSLTDNAYMPDPFLSVSITKPDGLGGHIVWEGLYSEEEAKAVFGTLENRLLGNPAAKTALHSFKTNCLKL